MEFIANVLGEKRSQSMDNVIDTDKSVVDFTP